MHNELSVEIIVYCICYSYVLLITLYILLICPLWSCSQLCFLCTDCPPEVTITPSDGGTMAVGDVLTCTSDSTLSSYTFTDSDGTVTDGNTVTLSEEGSFSFTCTSTVAMDTPCSASASVSGTAVGKRQNSSYH